MSNSVPIGAKGKVYVEGRNDMSTEQKMGISWTIIDPEGIGVVGNSPYQDWAFGGTAPGQTHTFDGPEFNLDKVGTWRIGIGLFMNPTAPVQVASYDGVLCVVAELAEFFAGTIVKMELKFDGIENIPVG